MSEMKSLTLNDKTYDCFVDSVARSQVEATAVVDSASGETIALSDASNYKLLGLHLYGKTIQDGTPTPDAPVDLVSVGDSGNITVNVTGTNDAQSMAVATPNGLPGIPVPSGGNYTDANGQQWICDEIDLARGVYVQRVKTEDLGAVTYVVNDASKGLFNAQYNSFSMAVSPIVNHVKANILCTHYIPDYYYNSGVGVVSRNGTISLNQGDLAIHNEDCANYTVDAFKSAMSGVMLMYQLVTPIETPLSEEELAAYAALHTYRDNTTVSNDAGAYMELEYVMDAKKYIDSQISAGILAATVE